MRLAGGESVVRDPAGNFHVFGTDWLGALWQISGSDARWSAQALGGVVLGRPAVTYANGRFDIFADGVNQTLHQKSYVNGHWTAWTQIVNRPFRAELNATVDVNWDLPPLRPSTLPACCGRCLVTPGPGAYRAFGTSPVRRGRDLPAWPLRRVRGRPRWLGGPDDIPGSRLASRPLDARTLRRLARRGTLRGSRAGQRGSIRKTATFRAPFSNASGVGASTTPYEQGNALARGRVCVWELTRAPGNSRAHRPRTLPATNDRGGSVVMVSDGGSDLTPVELLLAALGGCTAMDVDALTVSSSRAGGVRR